MTGALRRFVYPLFERHLIWLLLALIVLIGTTVPGFVSVRNFTNVLWAAAPLGCMVLGLFFVLLTAELDLSLESTFAVAPTVAVLVISMIENLMNLFGVEPSIRQVVFGLILLGAIYLASLQGRMRLEAESA